MGTDIHGIVEIKLYAEDAESAHWAEAVNVGNIIGRDYEGFALFFDVRNSYGFTPLFANKGIPEDSVLKNIKMGGEYHSASHFTLKDVRKLSLNRLHVETLRCSEQWNMLLDIMQALAKFYKPENVRCTVFFDC